MIRDILHFPPATPEKALATLERLEAKKREAQTLADTLQNEYARELLASEEGASLPAERKANTIKKLQSAKQEAERLEILVVAARERHKLLVEAKDSELRAQKWEEAFSLIRKREAIAEEVQSAAQIFAEKVAALQALNEDCYRIMPNRNFDWEAAFIMQDQTETAIRLLLVKLGMPWALSWPWGKEAIPDFMKNYCEAAGFIERLKERFAKPQSAA